MANVLIAGGVNGSGNDASAYLYNPTSGSFTSTSSLQNSRYFHTATLLANGKVLIVGGIGASGEDLASAELYNPSTGTFSATGSLIAARDSHSATLLGNGMVLIAGGEGPSEDDGYLASAELYNPTTGTFSSTGSLNTGRIAPATLLNNGTVLIAGGFNGSAGLSSAEIYNTTPGTSPTPEA